MKTKELKLIDKKYGLIKIELDQFDNGKTATYLEATTCNGYRVHTELSRKQKAKIISLLFESLNPHSSIGYVVDIINTCRGENKNNKINSMLSELDSLFFEIEEYGND